VTPHLHVSIGPVQTFVAQARRTRDLWGGSYLLSFLTAHAMRGAEAAGGRIASPCIASDPMIRWLEASAAGDGAAGPLPRTGSLPNQFAVALDGARPADVAESARAALEAAWRRVAAAVYDEFVMRAVPMGRDTGEIWRRQIDGFWEVAWVVTADGSRDMLARRKHWRTHALPAEAGDKCMVIPELQELSGYVRAKHSKEQDAFWARVRERAGEANVRKENNERLSAVALVKRLFASKRSVVEAGLGGAIDVRHWASSVDVAAVPWLTRIAGASSARATANDFASAVTSAYGEGKDILTEGAATLIDPSGARDFTREPFARLDANWYHAAFVASQEAPGGTAGRAVDERLRALCATQVDGAPLGEPSIYYALLLADGDRLGDLIASRGADHVSRALGSFTEKVPALVASYSGATIYAGGDDVLAILPVKGALEAARALAQVYRSSFEPGAATGGRAPSMSVAVVFAHGRAPLTRVLTEAHRLLDDVAKDTNGRDSLAVGIFRAEAIATEWVTAWTRPAFVEGEGEGERKDAVECLLELAAALSGGPELAEGGAARARPSEISGALIHDLPGVLSLLCGAEWLAPGAFEEAPANLPWLDFLRGEVAHRLARDGGGADRARVDRLARLMADVLLRAPGGGVAHAARREIGVDGLTLAAFLAGGDHDGGRGA